MTASTTAGVSSDSIAVLPGSRPGTGMRMIESILDISKITDYSCTNGDIFQLLEIPAGTLVLFAGAEVLTAFNGTSPTVDIDFAAGDDIIDGADITSTGFCAAGTNGQTNTVVGSAASTYTQFITATDTIDCKIAGAAPATGRLRVYATVIDLSGHGLDDTPADVDRDQLA